jgi:hypothetical protein
MKGGEVTCPAETRQTSVTGAVYARQCARSGARHVYLLLSPPTAVLPDIRVALLHLPFEVA